MRSAEPFGTAGAPLHTPLLQRSSPRARGLAAAAKSGRRGPGLRPSRPVGRGRSQNVNHRQSAPKPRSPSSAPSAARPSRIETGRFAKQASGAVVVRLGDTMTLVATVAGPGREGLDFFPLTVDYREKVYAAGKFPGGFIKREGRPTTKEILTSRLIDRPIRPLFPDSLPRRGPDPGRPDLGRPGQRPRRALDHRRLGHARARRASRSWARSAPCGSAGSTASSSRSRRPRS